MCVILAIMFGFGMPELMLLLVLFLWIALVLWVYRDAKRRGMNAALWVVLVLFLHLLGVAIYLIARGTRAK